MVETYAVNQSLRVLCAGLRQECSQAIYDMALAREFKRNDAGPGPKKPEVLTFETPSRLEQWYALRLRHLCVRQAAERAELQAWVRTWNIYKTSSSIVASLFTSSSFLGHSLMVLDRPRCYL